MKRILFMATLAMLAAACSTGSDKPRTDADAATHEPGALYKTEAVNDTTSAPGNTAPLVTGTAVDWDKKIVKKAEVELELKDFSKYNRALHEGLRAYGAYISSEEQDGDDQRTKNTVVIKVPVDQFENLLNSFYADDIKIVSKRITTADVTGDVVDTKSRMETRKHTRDQYLALLKQAKNMKEIIEVRNELNGIQEEIESAAGRVSQLTHEAAYSTIRLVYYQLNSTIEKPGEKTGYLVQFKDAMQTGGQVVWMLIIAAITVWPLILVLIIAFIVWKKRKQLKTLAAGKS